MVKIFVSFSSSPGKTGKYFYFYFFKKYNVDAIYHALYSHDIKYSIDKYRHQVSGISVSMPFKSKVIECLTFTDDLVEKYNSCNTIAVTNNELFGFNTDYYGMKSVLTLIDIKSKITILGDGSMASMFKKHLNNYVQYSRKLKNWQDRNQNTDVIINCTGLGTTTAQSPFENIPVCQTVIDLAIKPNELESQAKRIGAKYISGITFYKFQFIKQFEIYTGIKICENEFDQALSEFRPI